MKSLSYLKNSPLRHYLLLGLIAVELLMSFSFLGYIHVEPISITFAFIPVLIAGCILGPIASTIVGSVFGLASMWKASAEYVSMGDKIFSPLLSGAPFSSFTLSVVSRALFGLVVGLLYVLARKSRHDNILVIIISLFGRFIHSAIVYFFMGILFPEMGMGLSSSLSTFLSPENILTSVISAALVFLSYCFIKGPVFRRTDKYLQTMENLKIYNFKTVATTSITIIFTIISSCAIAFYFVSRMRYVLNVNGYNLTESTQYNLLHLQTQFLFGILSLVFLVALFLFLINITTAYVRQEAKFDSLTGVLNRNGFFPFCENILSSEAHQENIMYFIILDIDDFKHINDSFGHPKGDEILFKVAYTLQEIFPEKSVIGRLGGDEFAVMLYKPMKEDELSAMLNDFLDRIKLIPCGNRIVSCSIGVVSFTGKQHVADLYKQSDEYLYKAKSNGKGQFYIKQ